MSDIMYEIYDIEHPIIFFSDFMKNWGCCSEEVVIGSNP